ncbi:MAG TPA: hypothetical protein VIL28_01795, partial [Steroidobacteraceae bacterium]
GTLYGAVAGAVLVNYAKTYFTAALPEYWLYALGTLFVLVTLFLPRGVVGLVDQARDALAKRRASTPALPTADSTLSSAQRSP